MFYCFDNTFSEKFPQTLKLISSRFKHKIPVQRVTQMYLRVQFQDPFSFYSLVLLFFTYLILFPEESCFVICYCPGFVALFTISSIFICFRFVRVVLNIVRSVISFIMSNHLFGDWPLVRESCTLSCYPQVLYIARMSKIKFYF